ncbi:MAG: PAS domain S-box protein, partial [Dehalococcoidia bacterium]
MRVEVANSTPDDSQQTSIRVAGEASKLSLDKPVGKRKQVEEALKESEEKYRSLVESTSDWIWEIDRNGIYTYASPKVKELLGYEPEEVIGKTPFDLMPAEEAKRVANKFKDIVKNNKPIERLENINLHKDGHLVILETSGVPIFDNNGQLRGYRGVDRDITKHKQIEEELIKSGSKYRSLVETAGAGVVSGDLQGNLTFVNETFCRMLGYSPEEMVGKPFVDFVNPDDRAWVWDRFLMGMTHPTLEHHVEFSAIHKKGHSLWLSSNPTPMFYKGELVGGNAIIHDITERKQAEEAMRESEQKYRLLAENASDIIWTMDMNLRFTYMSPSVTKVRGYTVEEVMAQSLEEVFTPSSVEAAVKAFMEELAIESLEPKDLSRVRMLEVEHTCKDGSTVWVEINASFIRDADGQPVGILGVSREITERKQVEETLRRSEARYRTILDDMEESYYETDLAGNFTAFNDALCRHLGYSREEMMGMNYLVFTPPEDVKRVSQTTNQVYRTGEPVELFPREMIRKDGSRTFTETSIFPLRNERGEIIGFRGVGRDITERKQAEETSKESEEKFRTLAEESPNMIFINKMGRIVYANMKCEEMMGYKREELYSHDFDFVTLIAPEFREQVKVSFGRHTRSLESQALEYVLLTKDGKRIDAILATKLIKYEKEPAILGVITDITERKQAEEKYQTIVRTTIDGFWLTDMQGHFLDVNDAYCHLAGYSHDELLNMAITDVEAIEEPGETAKHIRKIKEVGYDRFETRHRRKDGEIIDVVISVNYLPIDGGRMFVFIRDISERKRAEEAQRLSEERYRTIVEEMDESYYEVDLAGNMTFVNDATCRRLGRSREE